MIKLLTYFQILDTWTQSSSKFVWLFTNEHEQVLKNLGTFNEECLFTARTQLTDRVDIIRLGELL